MPYLFNGYYADDALNSQVPIKIERLGVSIWQFMYQTNRDWMNYSGRFYPLGFLFGHGFFVLFPTHLLARSAHLFLVFSCLSLFCYLVYQWTRSRALVLLLVPLFGVAVQYRDSLDPVSGYPGFLQSVFLYTVGAIYLQLRSIETRNIPTRAWSVVLFSCGFLTYEIALSLLPLFFVLPWIRTRNFKKAIQISWPHFLAAAVYVAFTFYLRATQLVGYDGINPTFNLGQFLSALWIQLSAALPMNRSLYLAPGVFPKMVRFISHSIPAYLAVMTGMGLTYLSLNWIKKEAKQKNGIRLELIVLSLGLWVLPSILIASSKRWQTQMAPGHGYIPVFLSYFGTITLLGSFLYLLFRSKWMTQRSRKIQIGIQVLLSCLVGCILFINQAICQYGMWVMDQHYRVPREFLVRAYRDQLARNVVPGARFVSSGIYIWNNPDLSREISKKVKDVEFLPAFESRPYKEVISSLNADPYYFLNFGINPEDGKNGWAFLSQIKVKNPSLAKEVSQLSFDWIDPVLYVDRAQSTVQKAILRCPETGMNQTLDIKGENRDYILVPVSSFQCKLKDLVITVE
jgi:hypothetical protein